MSPVGPATWVQPPLYMPTKVSLVGCANNPPEVTGARWETGAQFAPEYGNGDQAVYDPSVSSYVGQILGITNVALSSNVATLTTANPHGYTVGESVVVFGLTNTAFNGTVVVTAVPSSTTFSYALTHANVGSTADSGAAVSIGEGAVAVAPMGLEAHTRFRTTIGFAVQDYVARAVRRLRVQQYRQIESEFWTAAAVSANPSLVSTGQVAKDGTGSAPAGALSPTRALGVLEGYAGALGLGRLMIHCSPRVFYGLDANHLVSLDGPVMGDPGSDIEPPDGDQDTGGPDIAPGVGPYLSTETLQPQNPGAPQRAPITKRGTVVVPGDGYSGAGPTGNAGAAVTATTEWMYCTGPVDVRLDTLDVRPDSMRDATDRGSNTVAFRADRRALVTFDPASVFAVQVDLSNL